MANTLRESNAILETYNLRGLFSLMKTCDLTNKTPMTQTNTKTKRAIIDNCQISVNWEEKPYH